MRKIFKVTLIDKGKNTPYIKEATLPSGSIVKVEVFETATCKTYEISQELNDKIALHLLTTNTVYKIRESELEAIAKLSKLEQEVERLTRELEEKNANK